MTLDKEKPVVEEQSDSSISKIIPNDDPDSNNVVEQCSSSAGGQDKSNHIGSDRTGLTGVKTGLTASSRVSRTKFKPKMVKRKTRDWCLENR